MEVFDPVHLDGVLQLCRAEGWPTYPEDRVHLLAVGATAALSSSRATA